MTEVDKIERKEIKVTEESWCRIGGDGELEHLDWIFVEKMAAEFDSAGEHGQKTQTMIMGKLLILVRKQTLERVTKMLAQFEKSNNDTSAVILFNPLEDK